MGFSAIDGSIKYSVHCTLLRINPIFRIRLAAGFYRTHIKCLLLQTRHLISSRFREKHDRDFNIEFFKLVYDELVAFMRELP